MANKMQPSGVSTTSPLRRRRFQYTLRTLLGLFLVFGLALGWLVPRMKRAAAQRRAVEAIEADYGGAIVAYHAGWFRDRDENHLRTETDPCVPFRQRDEPDCASEGEPDWLRNLLGADFFHPVLELGGLPDDGLKYLDGLRQLQVLCLNGVPVSDSALSNLRNLTALRRLDLSETNVTDAGLCHLSVLKHLRTLKLSQTRVQGQGLRHVSELRELENLDLSECMLTDTGMESLANMPQLRCLKLSRDAMSPEGRNPFGDRGAACLAGLVHLRTLDLEYCYISAQALMFLRRLTELEELDITGAGANDETMRDIGAMAKLRILRIGGDEGGITDKGLSYLKACSRLQELQVVASVTTSEGLAHLRGLAKLDRLVVWTRAEEGSGSVYLDGPPQLRRLPMPPMPCTAVTAPTWCRASTSRNRRNSSIRPTKFGLAPGTVLVESRARSTRAIRCARSCSSSWSRRRTSSSRRAAMPCGCHSLKSRYCRRRIPTSQSSNACPACGWSSCGMVTM